jgi:beta-galactosidase
MNTISINRSNRTVSPLVATESIWNAPTMLSSSIPVRPWIHTKTGTTDVNKEIELPYSINAIDGQSSSYSKNTYTLTSTFTIHKLQPTYLWFLKADQSAEIYVNDEYVETHWGGYISFFIDITNFIKIGTNDLTVILNNKTRSELAPDAADFNFNATLGEVRLLSSPVLPDKIYGYDGFHIKSTVTDELATITVETSVPNYADVIFSIKDEKYSYSERKFGKGKFTFTTSIENPHLWDGKIDPHLYDVTLEIYYDGELYHRLNRAYGFRYFSYVWNDATIEGYDSENTYTGFLLNGHPYQLRGACMHNDLQGKANAVTPEDLDNDFDVILDLGCNFLRLVHYPHQKQVYDYCDKLGIVVQTEAPWLNKCKDTQPQAYWDHLELQMIDMVTQHYNHPCIVFWGMGNEIALNGVTASLAKEKTEYYRELIRSYDTSRWVGFVSHNLTPKSGYGYPELDYYASNNYTGWYKDYTKMYIDSAITKGINDADGKPWAFSEYGGGGTQNCHSDDFHNTTNHGSGGARHDIEKQMWIHEGHIEVLKQRLDVLYTSIWQLFDVAVSSRNEGYTKCFDGVNSYIDDTLRYLNDKGIVNRDHKTKKDTFYAYKAWWNPTPFVHICGKDYTKKENRAIKCYSNDGDAFTLYVNDQEIETVTPTNGYIVLFTAYTFNSGDVVKVTGTSSEDTFTFE